MGLVECHGYGLADGEKAVAELFKNGRVRIEPRKPCEFEESFDVVLSRETNVIHFEFDADSEKESKS